MQPSIAARASSRSRRSPVWTSQPSRIHCGALALVGDAHLEVGVAQQPAHDGGADRAGAAGDEDAVHACVSAATSLA